MVARLEANTGTVIDLRSGDTRLIVNAGMDILGLKITGSTVVVLGEGKVVTWNLPAGDHTPNTRASVNDSVRTTTFNYSGVPPRSDGAPCAAISPDLNRITIINRTTPPLDNLNVYDMSSGKRLADTIMKGRIPWFAPNGREVWCSEGLSTRGWTTVGHMGSGLANLEGLPTRGWTIVEDRESDLTRLDPIGPTTEPSGGPPWQSPRGYKVMGNGWVLNPNGKRSLWLPRYWISHKTSRRWGGRFLGLLHSELPEAVILELDE